MSGRTWLVIRAVMAVVLMVGFYVLAIGTAGLLLLFAYAQVVYLKLRVVKLVIVCVAGAAAILWSLIPRRDKFIAPGPQVDPASEPALFDMLKGVATATDQSMPTEVYVIADVNAWVAQRGGVMGIGTRRIMGLGLPLLQSVTVPELKAILAHEFGHYHAGDVALGPWIYRTRAAMERTIRQLSNSALRVIFLAYGRLFLRVTHAVSRRQEYIADELAARVVGAAPMTSALRKVHATTPAFSAYWQSEVMPVLSSGFVPPIMSGFAQFVQVKAIAEDLQKHVNATEAESATDPYDTHPSLKDRIAALGALPQGPRGDDRPATTLLSSVDKWEQQLLSSLFGAEQFQTLKPVDWAAVVDRVYLPAWRKLVADNAKIVNGLTIGSLPLSREMLIGRGRGDLEGDGRITHAKYVIATAVALLLVDAGWRAETAPGEKLVLRGGDTRSVLFEEINAFAGGERTSLDLGLPAALPLS